MSQYDNTNTGTLFVNRDKYTDDTMRTVIDTANPNWPDAKGSINAAGVEYWLSGWRKTAQSGKKFWSFSLKPKEPKADAAAAATLDSIAAGMEDDEIPFG